MYRRIIIFIILIIFLLITIDNGDYNPLYSSLPNKHSLRKAEEQGYLKAVNKSIEVDGLVFKVDYAIIDSKTMILFYSFESVDDKRTIISNIDEVQIYDIKNNRILRNTSNSYSEKDKTGSFITRASDNVIPNEIKIVYNDVSGKVDESEKHNRKNFTMELNVSKYKIPEEMILYEGFNFILKDFNVTVKDFQVYPLSVIMKLKLDVDSYDLLGKECYLIDEKGQVYEMLSGGIEEDYSTYILKFESFYFDKPKELFLVIEPSLYEISKVKPEKEKKLLDSESIKVKVY